jgi:RNA polymerase sigma-70 factor (ECF subfamily)
MQPREAPDQEPDAKPQRGVGRAPNRTDSLDESRFLELLERVRRRDQAALGELLGHYQAELRAQARRDLGAGLRAELNSEDLQQTVLREAVRDLHKGDFQGRQDFRNWLAALMRNKLRKKARDLGRQKRDGGRRLSLDASHSDSALGAAPQAPAAPGPSPASALLAEEQRQRVLAALSELEPTQRRVVELRILEALPWQQVAAILGLSEKAAQALWAKARLRLGRQLDS